MISLFLLLLLAADPVVMQSQELSRGTAAVYYLFWASDELGPACFVKPNGEVFVSRGRERSCWEQTVMTHNEGMNNQHNHRDMDDVLMAIASRLGKTFVRCAK